MKTTRTIVTTLLLVAAMLIGAVLVPATFAANEPIDEPYDGEVYISNGPVYTAPAGSVSHDYSLNVLVTEDVLSEVAIYGNNGHYVDTTEVVRQQITTIINNNYVYSHSVIQGPTEYDFVIADFNLMRDLYIQYVTNEIVVCDYSCGDCYVVTIGWEAMEEIMRIYRTSTALSVELTDSIVDNLVFMAETKGFGVGVLSYEDICNVVYETGNYYQSAMEIASALSVGCMTGEQAVYYTGLAMQAQTWEEMRENLICAIERYAATTVQYTKDFGNNSFAANLVLESFQSHWYDLDTMDIVHYALWMSVVAGGCYC